LRVQGSGFRVQGSGFRVQGSGFRVQGSGFRVQGAWSRVQGRPGRAHGADEAEVDDGVLLVELSVVPPLVVGCRVGVRCRV